MSYLGSLAAAAHAILLLLCSCCAFAAVAKDRITALPGWEGPLPSAHYSGFVPLDGGRNVHYWFVESERDPQTDPVVLWVQGGPGGSSLEGMFTEMGPFTLNLDSLDNATAGVPKLYKNQFAWTNIASMIFWEAPAGVGFSYCNDGSCPAWNDTNTAVDNANFLCEFFALYPEYAGRDFYLTGESYAGVYIPTVTLEIMKRKCPRPINLKGMAIGNGCTGTDVGTCSPGRAVYTLEQLYLQSMISQKTHTAIEIACADSIAFTQANSECQRLLLLAGKEAGPYDNYNVHDTCGPWSALQAEHGTFGRFVCEEVGENWPTCQRFLADEKVRAPKEQGRNDHRHSALGSAMPSQNKQPQLRSLQEHAPENYKCGGNEALAVYLSHPLVQKAIHVTESGVKKWGRHSPSWTYTRTYKNLLVEMPQIIDQFRVLIYSGDFDAQIPHVGTEEWTRGLGYNETSGGGWRPWYVGPTAGASSVAGYVTEYDVPTEFTYLTVKAAGHMVPTFKPAESLAMIERFLNAQPY